MGMSDMQLPAVYYNRLVGSMALNPLNFFYQCYQTSRTGRSPMSTPDMVVELGHFMSDIVLYKDNSSYNSDVMYRLYIKSLYDITFYVHGLYLVSNFKHSGGEVLSLICGDAGDCHVTISKCTTFWPVWCTHFLQ